MKKTLLFIALMLFSLSCKAQKIEGVVSYYFNSNYGYKPDIGAEVYIIKENDSIEMYKHFRLIQDFAFLRLNWQAYNQDLEMYGLLTNREKKHEEGAKWTSWANEKLEICKKSGVENKYQFDSICAIIKDLVFDLKVHQTKKILQVDGAGRYSADINPGQYLIIIKSKGRTANNSAEYSGKLDAHYIYSKANDTQEANSQFSL